MREAHALGRLGAQGASGLTDLIRETHRAIAGRGAGVGLVLSLIHI